MTLTFCQCQEPLEKREIDFPCPQICQKMLKVEMKTYMKYIIYLYENTHM